MKFDVFSHINPKDDIILILEDKIISVKFKNEELNLIIACLHAA